MKKYLLLTFLLLHASAILLAQTRRITGTITDAQTNSGLPGVTIQVKDQPTNTITDGDGRFALNVPQGNVVLVITYVGYRTENISVGAGQSNVVLAIKADDSEMGEVIVTAMGIKKDQRKLGYATSTITSKDIVQTAPTNFAAALYGKAPGVTINSNPGGATSAVGIQIRGINSISYQRQPLLVVDGVIIRNDDANNEGYWGGNQRINGNGLLDINPENIESINVLKGAAASALYGSDANFGVIVVTTKNGKGYKKGIGVDFNLSANMEQVSVAPDLQTEYGPGYDRVTNMTAFGANDEGFLTTTVNGQQVQHPIYRAYGQFGPKLDGRQVYWWDGEMRSYSPQENNWKAFYRDGFSTIANVAINNATDKGSYRLSYTRNDYKGVQIGGKQDKNTFNFNSSYKITPKLSVDLVVNYVNEKVVNRPRQIYFLTNNFGGFFSPADHMDVYFNKYQTSKGYKYVPYNSTLDPEERLKLNIRAYDFLEFLWNQLANNFTETTNRFMPAATVNYNLAEGLTLRGRMGVDYSGYFAETKNRSTQPISFGASGYYGTNSNQFTYTYGDVLLSYEKKVSNDVTLTASAGYQGRHEKYRFSGAGTRDGLTTENWFSLSASQSKADAASRNEELIKDGYFGMLGFEYKNYLFLEGTVRRERSSSLAPGNNTFVYPGVSAAFELSNAFNLPAFVTYSKLRAAGGIVGNPPPRYAANVLYSPVRDGDNVITIDGVPTLIPPASGYGNNELKNEMKREMEFGWENKFFGNRLGVDVTYYNNKVMDMIMNLTTPSTIGSSSVLINAGDMRNYGWEFALSGTPYRTSKFSWDTRVNFAFNRNKVTKLEEGLEQLQLANLDNASLLVVAKPGQPSGDILGYVRKKDASGNYIVTDAGYYDVDKSQQVSLGNIQPKVNGGIMNTFTYGNFSLNTLVDFRWGGKAISQALLYGTGAGMYENSLFGRSASHGGISYYTDASGAKVQVATGTSAGPGGQKVYDDGYIIKGVTADGRPNTTIIEAADYYLTTYTWGSWPGYNDNTTYEGAVFDNNFFKVREVALSYTLPAKLKSKLKMQNCVLTLYGRNLFYIYKSLPYLDAEEGVGTNYIQNAVSAGQGSAATRSMGASIRVTF